MSPLRTWLRRLSVSLRPQHHAREREAELQAHLDMATDNERARGLSPDAAARAARLRLGNVALAMDAVQDQRGLPWVDALAADLRLGWRQILRHRTASLAAILSLGLAVGATMAAFQLVDALLLRPLPVVDPGRLFMAVLSDESIGGTRYRDEMDYLEFRDYSGATSEVADSLLLGFAGRTGVVFEGATEPERVYRQYVSGNVFPLFGVVPAAGRLLIETDDDTPGAEPVAVLSYEFWTRRFDRAPTAIGSTFRNGSHTYQIVGVAPKGFVGTEPGKIVDLFTPASMNVEALTSPGWSWFRMWLRPHADVTPERVREVLQARLSARNAERAKTLPADTSREALNEFLSERMELVPASGGVSGLQRTFRLPISVLAALAALVLLLACGNVANILATRVLSRHREIALRVSIGAGRARIVQMLVVESFMLALLATVVGLLFAQWSAPFVVSLLALPEDPVRLVLGLDLRTAVAGVTLTFLVTACLALAPVLRASAIRPAPALKGVGEAGMHRRLTPSLVALQMAFSVFVLFAAVLFDGTFTQLINRPMGYSDDRVVLLDTDAREPAGSTADWSAVLNTLRATPGVADAAAAAWVPLSDNRWRAGVKVTTSDNPIETHILQVSPGYFRAAQVGLVAGRDFDDRDVPPSQQTRGRLGSFVVNETFAKAFFGTESPIGRTVVFRLDSGVDATVNIVGLVRDTVYTRLRDRMPPIAYLPLGSRDEATLLVRGERDALPLVPLLRQRVSEAHPNFLVTQAMPQRALATRQLIPERLLATLSTFFAAVGLLVAVVGLYGVLNAAVQQRQRELGIRIALGAGIGHVVSRVALTMFALVAAGAAVGLVAGIVFGRLLSSLLFGVASTDPAVVATPVAVLGLATILAALPPALRAVRVDPVQVLRGE